jgi:hypothetical protein
MQIRGKKQAAFFVTPAAGFVKKFYVAFRRPDLIIHQP